jgi:hypothetical protein
MTPTPDREELLADVLAEAAPSDFRGALLGDLLQRVQQKRRFKLLRQRVGALGLAALVGILAWRHLPQFRLLPGSTAASYELVHTQVLADSAVVHTHPFTSARSLLAVSHVAVIQTRSGQFRTLGDDELLTMAARPAVLIRLGPHLQILVFADQPEPKKFPVN